MTGIIDVGQFVQMSNEGVTWIAYHQLADTRKVQVVRVQTARAISIVRLEKDIIFI